MHCTFLRILYNYTHTHVVSEIFRVVLILFYAAQLEQKFCKMSSINGGGVARAAANFYTSLTIRW